MELIFLGTGPTTPVKQNARTRSSLAVKTRNLTFMVDCTPDFLKQIEREKIDQLDFILFTHAHSDCIGGIPDLRTWLNKKDISKITVFMHKETYKVVKKKFKSIDHLNVKYFQSDVPITVSGREGDDGFKIIPFDITHSIQPGFPAVGFKFLDIVYSEDVGGIPKESMKYYKDANIVIFDAAMWFGRQIKGHYNTAKALQFAKQIKPKQFVLIQAGHTYPPQKEAEAKIQQYWKEIHGGDTKITLAYDGMRLSLREHISQVLYEIREGIHLPRSHGSLIYSGEKELIVKTKLFKHKVGAFLYLIEDRICYGIIQLKHPDKIDLTEFKKLEDKHKITEEEQKKWWPYKEVLYAYEFDIIQLFDEPKKIIFSKGTQTFIKDFKFLEEEKLIKDPKSYDPEKLSTDVLRDDWRIVNAWYATKKRGKEVKHSLEEIINLAKMIYLELKKRGTIFHPETMKPYSRELYKLVSNKSMENTVDLSNPKLLGELEDKKIIRDFVSVVGSYTEEGSKPHDVDFLIRLAHPTDFIKRAIETRILKDLSFANDVHFIWGDPEGPHDAFVPLYDLQLKRIKPLKIVKMQKEIIELDTVMPFHPMKPRKRFYKVDETVSYMFKTGNKYALEKKYNGYRAVLMKTGDRIKIYSDQKKDISKHFHTVLSEAKNLTNRDVVIDTELIYKDAGRSEIAKYVTGKGELDDSKIQLHVFDCIYYKKDLTKLPWYERKSVLHSLNFTDHIKEVSSIIVNNQEAAQKGIKFLRNLKGSEGAMIKRYDGKYIKNGETDAWIKFRNEDTIVGTILKVIKKEAGYVYNIGIKIKDTKRFHPRYISEYLAGKYLVLGNTFVTKQKFDNGDHIEVNIEETWRHKYPKKNDSIRYSIHKPRVMKKTTTPSSSWEELDKLAVSKGEEVVENQELSDVTGMIDADPKKVVDKSVRNIRDLANYRLIESIDRGEQGGYWISFANDEYFIVDEGVVVWRSSDTFPDLAKKEWEKRTKDMKGKRTKSSDFKLEATPSGTTTGTPGIAAIQGKKIARVRIPGPKKKKLEEIEQELQNKEGGEQIVKDFPERMQRNFNKIKESGGWKAFVIQWHLRGERSIHSDLRLDIGELLEGFTLFTPPSADKPDLLTTNPHNIRGTIKVPQPKEWLTVQGGYPAGAPGTTKRNAYFAIVAKGKYRPVEIEDHKITFELKSDSGSVKKVKSISKDDDKAIEAFNNKLPNNLKDLNGCFSYHIAHIGDRHIILFDKLKKCPKDGGE